MLIPDVNLPEGERGKWRITKKTFEDDPIMRITERYFQPGTYTQLYRGGVLVMSDTPAEKRDHFEFCVMRARGDVLISGLGLGMCVGAVLARDDVTSVTVIEIDQDLIDLVGPHYEDDRLTIINADIFEYKPKQRFNAVWHDVWDVICEDQRPEMTFLNRRWGQFSDWCGCWGLNEMNARRL